MEVQFKLYNKNLSDNEVIIAKDEETIANNNITIQNIEK